MTNGMFLLLFNSPVAHSTPECDDLKKDMIALELFLQDQEDKEKFCPKIKWTQPDIEVYKETLKSQLPKECTE